MLGVGYRDVITYAVDIDERGARGDRIFGVIDSKTRRVLSTKTIAALLDTRAPTIENTASIELPDATVLDAADRLACDRALSEWLARPVRLQDAENGGGAPFDMTFDPPNDDADRVLIPTPPGTFFGLSALHLLTLGALAAGGGQAWPTRRFRPNLVVETGDDAGGLAEDLWVGHQVSIGSSILDIQQRTVRCAIPLRAQPAGATCDALRRDVGLSARSPTPATTTSVSSPR